MYVAVRAHSMYLHYNRGHQPPSVKKLNYIDAVGGACVCVCVLAGWLAACWLAAACCLLACCCCLLLLLAAAAFWLAARLGVWVGGVCVCVRPTASI